MKARDIDKEEAIQIAQAVNKMAISTDSTLEVEETTDAYVVEWRRHLPEGLVGPDYDAKIWVEKKTGKILKHLVAP